jgi:hypothetical protein
MRADRNQETLNHLLIVDGHVHIYDCYKLASLLEAASINFGIQAKKVGHSDSYSGVMLLADRLTDRWFERLYDLADAPPRTNPLAGPWTFHRVPEDPRILLARRENFHGIFVVAGSQIISSEGLEVLALATTKTLPDGLPVKETLRAVRENDALAVLPWGFGKWLGRRGNLVKKLLESDLAGTFFLGDSGGRPVFWGTPSHFDIARSLGIRILPGTDPLPLTWETRRVGSFGFTLPCRLTGKLSLQHDLIQPLRTKDCFICSYGDLLGGLNFLRSQIALRLPGYPPVVARKH